MRIWSCDWVSESRRVEHLRAFAARLEATANRISWARFLVITGGAAVALGVRDFFNDRLAVVVAAVFFAIFLWLVIRSKRTSDSVRRARRLIEFRETEAARASLEFSSLPLYSPPRLPAEHEYAHDLNLFDERGLFRLVDSTCSGGGRSLLRDWFLNPLGSAREINARQALIAVLATSPRFRERLALTGSEVEAREGADKRLRAWLAEEPDPSRTKALPLLWGMSALTLGLLGLFLAGLIKPWFIFSWFVYLGTYARARKPIRDLFDEAYQIESGLRSFLPVLGFLESTSLRSPADSLLAGYRDEHAPSKFLSRVTSVAAAAGTGKSDFLGFVLNATVPWDLYFARVLDRLRPRVALHLGDWLDGWYELEALSSLAGLAARHDDYVYPEIDESGPVLEAAGLGHPLIPVRNSVRNDLKLTAGGEVALITGSNMSGKTTFLRTVCLNVLLARLGTVVSARQLKCRPLKLFTSIQIADSLADGISYFYAEVKRFKWLLRLLEDDGEDMLFAIDEIFRGTNNRERLLGSQALLSHLTRLSGSGMISTHDLELTALAESNPSIHNYHFTDEVRGGVMSFDYQLRAGPCPVTNALAIMQREGLPVKPPESV